MSDNTRRIGRSWKERVISLITQPIKLPGWAAVILFIYTIVPDTYSRTEFWIATAKTTGGRVATAASIVGSPYFGPSLLVFGLTWILFVGEPSKGVQRHHWLRDAANYTLKLPKAEHDSPEWQARDGNNNSCCGTKRTDDVCAYRRDACVEPARRANF